MKKISTFMLLVSVLWYAAAASGNTAAIIVAAIVTLTAFPIWAYVVAKKTGRNPWKWTLLSILLPLIGPLILAVTARKDIAAVKHKEMTEGRKGFWENRFGKFGGLIPYVSVLLFMLALAGLSKIGLDLSFPASSASHHSDMSYDVINGNETANLANGGLWLRASSFDLFSNMEYGGRIYAINETSALNVYKYCDDSARNLCELKGFIYYINQSDNDSIYRIDTSKAVKGEKLTEDSVLHFCIAEKIYYINKKDNNSIYCIDWDGKNKKKLSGNSASGLFQDYGNLYYINTEDNHINRMTIDGKNNEKFIDDRAGQIFTHNCRIYYINLDDCNRIYSVSNDGTGRRKESDYSADCLCFDAFSFYFANKDDQGRIYMLEGQIAEKLSDYTNCTNINALFGSVMFMSNGRQKFINTSNVISPVEYFPGISSMYDDSQAVLPSPPQLPAPPALIQQEGGTNIPPLPSINPEIIPSDIPAPDPDAFTRSNSPIVRGQTWPDYLPKDIPPIPANIVWIWGDPDIVRIQFKDLSLQGLLNYLKLMKDNGFSLEYIIYVQPGEILSEDDQKKLVKQGKFDAVRMKKDKYNFYIEYGANEGTYDLNVKDF